MRGTDRGLPFKQSYDHEAAARQKALELVGGAVQPLQPTWLPPAKLRHAEAADQVLEGTGITILEAAKFAAQNMNMASRVPIDEALEEYRTKRTVSGDRFQNIESAVRSFWSFLKSEVLGAPTRQDVENWIQNRAQNLAAASHNHLLNDLSTFCQWHADRKTLGENPCVGVDKKPVRRGPPTILGIDQAQNLFTDLEENFPLYVPAFALMTFNGVRPDGEMSRLDAALRAGKTLYNVAGRIEIDGKANGVRPMPMLGPTAAWLDAYPVHGCLWPEKPAKTERDLTEIRKRHGLLHEVLRHSEASDRKTKGFKSGFHENARRQDVIMGNQRCQRTGRGGLAMRSSGDTAAAARQLNVVFALPTSAFELNMPQLFGRIVISGESGFGGTPGPHRYYSPGWSLRLTFMIAGFFGSFSQLRAAMTIGVPVMENS